MKDLGGLIAMTHVGDSLGTFTQEVKNGTGVVTSVDLENEKAIIEILKSYEDELSLSGVYGEETGYNVFSENGDLIALVDPIDGTRAFVMELFYSSISVAFVDFDGEFDSGLLVLVNNQKPVYDFSRYTIFAVADGEVMFKEGDMEEFVPLTPEIRETELHKECVSFSNLMSHARQWNGDLSHALDGGRVYAWLKSHSRGAISLYSGAAEIIMVVSGRLGGFVSLDKWDITSHLVALEIAKIAGFEVGHVYSDGQCFDIDIDALFNNSANKFLFKDGSVIVANPALDLRHQIQELLG